MSNNRPKLELQLRYFLDLYVREFPEERFQKLR